MVRQVVTCTLHQLFSYYYDSKMNMRWVWHVASIQDSTNAFKICIREHKGKQTIWTT